MTDLIQWIKKNKFFILIVSVFILLVSGYFVSSNFNYEKSNDLNYIKSTINENNKKRSTNKVLENKKQENKENENKEIIAVYLCGKVKRIGVIKVKNGEILSDIINENGGFISGADYNRINLARVPKNGEKIYIPYIGEKDQDIKKYNTDVTLSTNVEVPVEGVQTSNMSNASGFGQASSSTAKININTAEEGILETIPNIGPSRAKAIIDYRSKHGAFKSINELDNVDRIGKKIIDAMKDYICIE